MRRRLQFRMSQLPSLKTPRAIAIFVVRFYREEYPVILSLDDHTVRFIDILPGSSAAAYSAFFSGLDRSQVKQILIDRKIAKTKRERLWLVAAKDGNILWIVKVKKTDLSPRLVNAKIHYIIVLRREVKDDE